MPDCIDDDAGPSISNGLVRIVVRANEGTFAVIELTGGRVAIWDAAMSVCVVDGPVLSTRGAGIEIEGPIRVEDDIGRGESLVLYREADEHEPDFVCALTLYDGQPFAVVEAEIINTTRSPLRVSAFSPLDGAPLDLGSRPDRWRFYKHGWQSWSPTLVLDCAGEDVLVAPPAIAPRTQPEATEGRFVSEMVTAIISPESGRGVVAGFVTAAEQMSQVWLDRNGGALTAVSYADGISVPPGGRLASERLLIEPTRTPLESMERYGDVLGKSMGVGASAGVATGWCSWYYYWQGVTEEAVLANLEELTRRREELRLEFVQVDDGWQAEIGDWLEVNEKFPHGLKSLVERIHEAGFKAGLWLAPFLMGAKSRLCKEHPEWAVQYKPDKPHIAMQGWGQDCYALDLTRHEAIDWLKTVFRKVCEDWGFDYVKIDFIYAGAVDGIRQNHDLTRAQAYRRGLEAIREAVGERFILGCGNPMGASVGIADGARISPDVAPFWLSPRQAVPKDMSEASAFNAIRNTITRWWMHGRLWQSDPDCLLVRESETALTADEAQTLGTVIAISGGMVLDSDDLTRLSDERRRWLSMLLPASGRAARPLDLFESDIPRLLELDVGSHRMLAVFNWDKEAATIEVPLSGEALRILDAWSREDLGLHRDRLVLEVAGHGSRLLAMRPAAEERRRDENVLTPLFQWPEG